MYQMSLRYQCHCLGLHWQIQGRGQCDRPLSPLGSAFTVTHAFGPSLIAGSPSNSSVRKQPWHFMAKEMRRGGWVKVTGLDPTLYLGPFFPGSLST